ncbi:hypothetical protein KTD31_03330 [Burkholderia multivorans]|uniref:hypothetical protein n=1 Tax=Burkholderia multivorans TaxID=87883 RepID=UPI001C225462|nr:hypothetical protein [Burkholderia multivorans]MBU9200385.1 hypothetical protein [Burkholderia multivorans]MDN8078490.1 hypothetical protein [Burkholderia multivorans]
MVTLRLISGGKTEPATQNLYGSVRMHLRKVLRAKLTPTLTVEDACHLYVFEEGAAAPAVEKYLADNRELNAAGLEVRMGLDNLPEGIVLTNPEKFKAKFPELADAVPVMLAYEGVQPYTDGLPRKASSLTVIQD